VAHTGDVSARFADPGSAGGDGGESAAVAAPVAVATRTRIKGCRLPTGDNPKHTTNFGSDDIAVNYPVPP
jgi:hypothetical protein